MSKPLNMQKRQTEEIRAIVPERDYIDGHPSERKIRKACFKSGFKFPGHNAAQKFNHGLDVTIRTIVAKTYHDMFSTVQYTSNEILTDDEREEHLHWIFRELEKYQQDAKALIIKHLKELKYED